MKWWHGFFLNVLRFGNVSFIILLVFHILTRVTINKLPTRNNECGLCSNLLDFGLLHDDLLGELVEEPSDFYMVVKWEGL